MDDGALAAGARVVNALVLYSMENVATGVSAAGVVAPLIALLTWPGGEAVREAAAGALASLVNDPTNASAVAAGGRHPSPRVPPLVALDACARVRCGRDPGPVRHRRAIMAAGGIPRLVALLASPNGYVAAPRRARRAIHERERGCAGRDRGGGWRAPARRDARVAGARPAGVRR